MRERTLGKDDVTVVSQVAWEQELFLQVHCSQVIQYIPVSRWASPMPQGIHEMGLGKRLLGTVAA